MKYLSKNKIYTLVLFGLMRTNAYCAEVKKEVKLLDYSSLNHKLELDYLRAGNHDSEGQNKYYIKTVLVALLDDEKEQVLDYAKKRKVEDEYHIFAKMELPAFKFYKSTLKSKIELDISGDDVRSIVRRAMNELSLNKKKKLSEDKLGVMIKIFLYEEEKKYFFLENDQIVGETFYYVIPFLSAEEPLYKNQKLSIEDELGLKVHINVVYSNNDTPSNE